MLISNHLLLLPECIGNYPSAGTAGTKGTDIGTDHGEASLSGGPSCEFCADMTLARITKCLAYWTHREAREASVDQPEEILPAEESTFSLVTGKNGNAVAAPPPLPQSPA